MLTSTRPLSVLIVEDNRDGADALAIFLGCCGHQVRGAYDGTHAVQTMRDRPYDAVVCDIGLPGMNGYDVAKEARRLMGRRPLLIAVTAYDAPLVREHARSAGFDHYFTKPADPNDIDRLLQVHADRLDAEAAGTAD